MKKLYFLDLFCGAGGTSQGIARACEKLGLDYWLTAVNHWEEAVKTHRANHIGSHHDCDIYGLSPRLMVPGGHVDLMCASPECIYHSNARGGGECDDQSRSAADELLKWLTDLDVSWLMIENVAEFIDWGPLHKRGNLKGLPIKEKKGILFRRWVQKLKMLGYDYRYEVLNSADYGAYTARKRFFLIATKTGAPIVFPQKTHKEGETWKPARDIIDFGVEGSSVFNRKKPLVENSMRRVCHGLEKFNGISLDLDYAMECAQKRELPKVAYVPGLEPFFAKYNGGAIPRVHSVNEPMRTVDTSNRFALLTPFFAQMYGTNKSRSMEKPLTSVTTVPKSYVCEPYLAETYGQSKSVPINRPVPTILGKDKHYLCEPFILPQQQGYDKMNVRSIHDPMPTITGKGAEAVLEPFFTKYYGTGTAVSIEQPLGTITTKDRFGLNQPFIDGCALDVDYRLMQPHELAAAMGFPPDYIWPATPTATKKMIGNAVECTQSEALVSTIIRQHRRCA